MSPSPPNKTIGAQNLWRRLYIQGVEEGLESLAGYRPGGYHPIHLQDELNHGRYRVIHKLGHGGSSTIWLCRDQKCDEPIYVAVKILIAGETGKDCLGLHFNRDISGQYLCFPLERFESQSVNGTHVCLVYPVLGSTVDNAACIFEKDENFVDRLRQVSKQVAEALAVIHSLGICHADFRPSNILLEVESLDGIDEQNVISRLGEPETTNVLIRRNNLPTPEVTCAPKYLVYPVDFEDVEHQIDPPRIRVIDFGQSFYMDQPPQPPVFGIPANYAAGEVLLDNCGGMTSDLWSLGCTLYEIRLGQRLFDVFQIISKIKPKQDYIEEIALLLGQPPGQWAEWCGHRLDTKDPNTMPGFHTTADPATLRAIYDKITGCPGPAGLEREDLEHWHVSIIEAEALADLLGKLLRYQQHDRLSAQDVAKHAWFNLPLQGD